MHTTATVRPDIADSLIEYARDSRGQFMGSEIFPVYRTSEKTGDFHKIEVGQATQATGSLVRAPGATYDRIQHVTTSDNYACVEYGIEEAIDDSDRRRLQNYFNCELEAGILCMRHLLLKYEVRVAEIAFDASTFSGYTGGVSTEWNNSGAPNNDIADTKLTIKQNLGGVIDPGSEWCLAISETVRQNIVQNSNVQSLLRGGTGANEDKYINVQDEALAAVLGVDRLFYSAAQDNGSDVWDDEYALLFVRRGDNLLTAGPQLGRTFMWETDAPETALVETYRDEARRSDVIRVRQNVDEKLLMVEAGYLLSNIST